MTDIFSTRGSSLDHLREVIAQIDTCMSDVNSDEIAADLFHLDHSDEQLILDHGPEAPICEPNVEPSTLAESVMRNTSDAVFVLSDLYCVSCNLAAIALLKRSWTALRRQNFLQLVSQTFAVGQDWIDNIVERLTQKGTFTFDLKKQKTLTADVWCEFNVGRIEFKGVEHLLVVVRDISNRKNHEIELKRNCDFLLNTINAVSEPVSVKASNLDIVFVNDSFCQMHNVRREDILGKNSTDSFDSPTANKSVCLEREVLATGKKQSMIDEFIDTNADPFMLSTYLSAFHDPSSGSPYLVAASRDVTSEMKRENRLRLLASVFEAAQEGVAILNPQGEICEANPEFIATIGKSHATVLGRCLSTVLNCEPYHFPEIIELAQAGRPWFGKVNMVNKRNEEIACWLSISPSKNLQGETVNLIAMFSDITQIEETKRELRRQALHDHLTDLPNRRYFRKQIAELIESDTGGIVRFGVSFLDLDDFKIVNDTLGHNAGDQLLVEVSKRLKETLAPDCFMARFGGDEFALLIPERVGEELKVQASANAVVDALGQSFNLAGHEVHISVSIGTTVYPDHATDVESLMRHADVAMYKAKEEGKNNVTFFSAELVEIVEKRQIMLSELRQAVENRELTVVYQPKLCLKTNQINSCEALVRWTKSDGSVVSPAKFIPLAEDFGLISMLGDQVLETVGHQAKRWHDAGLLPGPIAVNLSPRQLKEPNFIDRLVQIIEITQIRPEWIELEITENAVEQVDRVI